MNRIGSVTDAANRLGCNPNHIYYLLNIGELFAVKVRWIYRIDLKTVEDYATRRPQEGTGRDSSSHHRHPGYLFDLESLGLDSEARADARRRTPGLHHGRGMERDTKGLSRLSRPQRNPVEHPAQLEFAIA